MKKKVLSVLLTLAMTAAVFAGCGTPENGGTGQTEGSGTSAVSQTAGEKEEITISSIFIINKDVAVNHDPLDKLLKEKFNIVMKWQDIPFSSQKEKLNMLFAAGEYPEMLYQLNSETEVKNWGTQGYLQPVNGYLSLAPNYEKLWTEEEWETTRNFASNADGNLYYLPTKSFNKGEQVWIYRMSKLNELGLEIPKTTDELYEVLKAFKEKYPDSIPIANRWGFNNLLTGFTLAFRTSNTYFFDPDTEKLEYGPATDKYRSMLIYLAKLYQEGLIDQEFATATDTQWEEIYANGLNVLEYSYTNRVEWANNMMKNADPNADWQWTSEYITAFPEKEPLVERKLSYSAWGTVFTKAMSGEKIERWMEVVDWAATEEGQRWFSMGEEGVTYEMKDGEPVFLPDIYSTSNMDGTTVEELGYGYYLLRYDKSLAQIGYGDVVKLYEQTKKSPYRKFVSYNLSAEQEKELVDPEMQIKDITEEYTLKYILGSADPGDDKKWQEYLHALNSVGLENVLQVRTEAAVIND